jgi:hypothetical protein
VDPKTGNKYSKRGRKEKPVGFNRLFSEEWLQFFETRRLKVRGDGGEDDESGESDNADEGGESEAKKQKTENGE